MNRILMIITLAVALLLGAPVASEGQESSSEELFGGCTIERCASICWARHCSRCESGGCRGQVQCLAGWCHCSGMECTTLYWDVIESPDGDDQADMLVPFGAEAWEALIRQPETGC